MTKPIAHVSDHACRTAYLEHGSIKRAAKAVGMSRSAMHRRLNKLGVAKGNPGGRPGCALQTEPRVVVPALPGPDAWLVRLPGGGVDVTALLMGDPMPRGDAR